jgi:hypothetical protein
MKRFLTLTTALLALATVLPAQNLNGDYTSAKGQFWAVAATTNSVAKGSTNWVAIKPNGNATIVVQGITLTTCTNAARINFLTPIAVLDVVGTNDIHTNIVVDSSQTNAAYNSKECLFYGAASNLWLRGWVFSATGTNIGSARKDGTVAIRTIDKYTVNTSLSLTNYRHRAGDKLYILEKSAVRFYPNSLTNNSATAGNDLGGVVSLTWEPSQPIFVGKPYPLNPVVVELDPTVVLAITPTAAITNWIWNVWGRHDPQ